MTRGNRTRQEFVLFGGNRPHSADLTVRGANPPRERVETCTTRDLEAQHAFQVSGATDVVLDDVQAYDVYGDFVYIGPADTEPSKNVTVTNSTFDRSWPAGHLDQRCRERHHQRQFDRRRARVSLRYRAQHATADRTFHPDHRERHREGVQLLARRTRVRTRDIGDIQISGNRMAAATGGLIFVFASGGAYRGPYLIKNNRSSPATRHEGRRLHRRNVLRPRPRCADQRQPGHIPSRRDMPAVEVRDSHQVRTFANTFIERGPDDAGDRRKHECPRRLIVCRHRLVTGTGRSIASRFDG